MSRVLEAVKQAVTAFVCLKVNREFVCLSRESSVGEVSLKYAPTWQRDTEVCRCVCLLRIEVCVQMPGPRVCGGGMLMCCLRVSSSSLCVCAAAGTQRWPCRCSTTPDTAPGAGWRWWSLWCGSSRLPSPARYCLDSTTLVTAASYLPCSHLPAQPDWSRTCERNSNPHRCYLKLRASKLQWLVGCWIMSQSIH